MLKLGWLSTGGVLGGAVVAAGFLLVPSPTPQEPAAEAGTELKLAPTAPRLPQARVPEPEPCDPGLTEELHALRVAHSVMQLQLRSAGLEEEFWPDVVESYLEPARVEETLYSAVDGLDDVEVTAVDCMEYPCLTVLEAGPDVPVSTESYADVIEAFRVAAGGLVQTRVSLLQFVPDGTHHAVISIAPAEGLDPVTESRTQVRVQVWTEELAAGKAP